MDDPWGSPWMTITTTTTSTTTGTTEKTSSLTKPDLEPPPRAFLSTTNSPRLPAVTVQSPWADTEDDGFGDWTTADSSATTAQSTSGWGGAWSGVSDGIVARSPRLPPTPKDESFGTPSPIAWPGNIVLSSSCSKHTNGSLFRQPSPDPWAPEIAVPEDSQDGHSTPRLVLDQHNPPTVSYDEIKDEVFVEEPESTWSAAGREPASINQDATKHYTAGYVSPEVSVSHASELRTENTLVPDHPGQSLPRVRSRPWSTLSRSSSISENDSDRNDDRQDSPITSIDEDSKSRIPLPPRKVSGKVQELVEKFDDLAKAAVEASRPVNREREDTLSRTDSHDSETTDAEKSDTETTAHGNVGELEGAEKSLKRRARSPHSSSPDPTYAPGPPSRESPSLPEVTPVETATAERRPDTFSSCMQRLVSKFGPMKFDVDLEQADVLFDALKLGKPVPNDSSELGISDRIITDNFTEISERKTWYRISRHGSSRKHNSGDEDNYRRVTWRTSTAHGETLKIVRRWMEQDSIAGRTTLGGISAKGNMFGWDSAAEPVALDKIFGKRREQAHSRQLSRPQPQQVRHKTSESPAYGSRKTSKSLISPTEGSISSVGSPTALFGWSTGPTDGAADSVSSAELAGSSPTQVEITKSTVVQLPAIPIQQQRTPAASLNKHAPTPLATSPAPPSRVDVEDEWGEMVSSPPGDLKPSDFNGFATLDSVDDSIPNPATQSNPSPSRQSPVSQSSQTTVMAPHKAAPAANKLAQFQTAANLSVEDPWSPADILVFGSSATRVPGNEDPNVKTAFTPTTPTAIVSSIVSANTARDQSISASPPQESQAETNPLVQQILNNLPDFSYMLR